MMCAFNTDKKSIYHFERSGTEFSICKILIFRFSIFKKSNLYFQKCNFQLKKNSQTTDNDFHIFDRISEKIIFRFSVFFKDVRKSLNQNLIENSVPDRSK